MTIEYFNFFWISSLLSWANTFKTQELRPKIENFLHHSKLCTTLILRKFINTSLHHAMKIKDFNFFLFRHSFRGLTPLKLKNFDLKLKFSNNTQNFAQR